MPSGPLSQDSGGRFFTGPWDTGANVGRALRGANVSGEYADARVVLYDSTGNALAIQTSGADGEADAVNSMRNASRKYQFNGTTWDRKRGNTEGTLLTFAARTSSTTSAIQTNHNARGVILTMRVAAYGSSGLNVGIYSINPENGAQYMINGTNAVISATGPYMYIWYPGGADSATVIGFVFNRWAVPLPRTWQAYVNHGDGSSHTYSLSYQYIL